MTDLSGRSPASTPHAMETGTLVLASRDVTGDGGTRPPPRLRSAVATLLRPRPAVLVVRLGDDASLTSDTVDVLLWVHHRCAERGVRMVLRRPPRRSLALLRASGLLSWLRLEGDEAAVGSARTGARQGAS